MKLSHELTALLKREPVALAVDGVQVKMRTHGIGRAAWLGLKTAAAIPCPVPAAITASDARKYFLEIHIVD